MGALYEAYQDYSYTNINWTGDCTNQINKDSKVHFYLEVKLEMNDIK